MQGSVVRVRLGARVSGWSGWVQGSVGLVRLGARVSG